MRELPPTLEYSLVKLPTIDDVCEFIYRGDTSDDQVRKIIEKEDGEGIAQILEYHSTIKIVLLSDILYNMPDHKNLVNEFMWQTDDMLPHFPRIRKFLDYWVKNIDGPLKSVDLAYSLNVERPSFGNGKFDRTIN